MTEKTKSREAGLNSVIRDQVEKRLRELRTTAPGIVDSFDPATKRATIQPAIQRVLVDGRAVTLPKLINVPVGALRAGGFAITLPVKQGDECMIHFCERSLDNWIRTGRVQEPNDLRIHHLSDAYFIPTSTSEPNGISDYDADNMVIRNDANTQKITFSSNGDITVDSPADAVINTSGDATINAGGDCKINGTRIINNGPNAGVVTTLSINPTTGLPFPDGSQTLLNIDG